MMKKVYLIFTSLLLTFLLSNIQIVSAHTDDCSAHPDDPALHDEHCAVFELVHIEDATHEAISNGSWFSTSTWNTGAIPNTKSKVFIDSGFVVSYDASSETEIYWLRVDGTLNFSTIVNTKLKINTFIVNTMGIVTMGSITTPIPSTITSKIIFTDDGPIDTDWDPHFFSKGLVSHGNYTTYGASKLAFCTISLNHLAGATSIKTVETPTGWKVGDKIVLAGTRSLKNGNNNDNSLHQDEVLTITSISGKNIYFTNDANGSNALLYDHSTPAGYGLKYHLANITRNIVFETENYTTVPVYERAHVMLMHNVNQSIAYAAFNGLGRTDKQYFATDPVIDSFGVLLSGGENPRGRYALHIHKAGTNNAAAIPLNIKGCVVYGTPGWGIVSHASHAIIEQNVVFDFIGGAYITEEGNELGGFYNNIAMKGRGGEYLPPGSDEYAQFLRAQNNDMAFEGDGFWIKSTNVEIENNIATSCAGTGFNLFADDDDFDLDHKPKIPTINILNSIIANGDDSIHAAIVPVRKNNNSQVYNTNLALNIWTFNYNSDNIGDFSNFEYTNYTHDILSVFSNFKFWNLLSEGIKLSYSSQIYLKDGIILGDLDDHFTNEEWFSLNENSGQAIVSGIVTGQMVFDNITMAGWKQALSTFRTDESICTDEAEYHFRTSKVIGGSYTNNLYNIQPEKGINEIFTGDQFVFGKYFEISGSPIFTAITANVLPVAEFAYSTLGSTSIKFDAALSSDSDPGVTTAGNGVAAYVWNFGDGSAEQYGKDIMHRFATAGTYSVSLTVYDSQGQTNTKTKNVYVTSTPLPNIIINPGFENGSFLTKGSYQTIRSDVQVGWIQKDEWNILDGKANISKAISEIKPLAQIIKNEKATQGVVEFSFQAKNLGDNADVNNLWVEVIGVNDEFVDDDITVLDHLEKRYNNDLSFDKDVLLFEDFGLSLYDWQTFKRNIDFGSGYDYILIKFYAFGLKPAKLDVQQLDNICLPCVCQIPQANFETTLTSTHVRLVWQNVGATEYKVQIKPTGGGAWTTYTVNNTFLELSTLLPGTTYQWKVSALCETGYTAYSTLRKFITPISGSLCTNPTTLSASLITSTAATVTWNTIPSVTQYQLSYKKSTSATWTNINTTSTTYALSGLTANTNYQWRVRSECADGWKQFTVTNTFITAQLKESDLNDAAVQSFSLYPNPATEKIYIEVEISDSKIAINIFDLTGRNVAAFEILQALPNEPYAFDINHLSHGIYLIELNGESGIHATEKLVIE